MAQQEWFRSWFASPYYPVLYQHRDEEEAAEFVTALLHYLKPEAGARAADIACGEGRFAQELARAGLDVFGLDLSVSSIQKAKRLETDNLHFYVHDMRLPFFVNYFDLAFNFFTSFGYFETIRDHHQAAQSFAACLRPGGDLVIDYLNAEKSRQNLKAEETVVRGELEFQLSRKVEDGYFIKDISFQDPSGASRRYRERVANFDQHDFENLFAKYGMKLVAVFGDYKLSPFDVQQSPRLILHFKKEQP